VHRLSRASPATATGGKPLPSVARLRDRGGLKSACPRCRLKSAYPGGAACRLRALGHRRSVVEARIRAEPLDRRGDGVGAPLRGAMRRLSWPAGVVLDRGRVFSAPAVAVRSPAPTGSRCTALLPSGHCAGVGRWPVGAAPSPRWGGWDVIASIVAPRATLLRGYRYLRSLVPAPYQRAWPSRWEQHVLGRRWLRAGLASAAPAV